MTQGKIAITSEQKRIAELEDALKPFALWITLAETMRGVAGAVTQHDDEKVMSLESSGGKVSITVGHLRKARAILETRAA